MCEWIVTIFDKRGFKLAQFATVGSAGKARRAGYERADVMPTARSVKVVRA